MNIQKPCRRGALRRTLLAPLIILASTNAVSAADYIWKRDANAPLATASNWFTGGTLPYSANTASWVQATVAPANGDRVVGWTSVTSGRVSTFGASIQLSELSLTNDTVPAASGYAAQIGLSNNVALTIDVLNLALTDNTQILAIRGGGATTTLTIGELNLTRGTLTTSATSIANYFVGNLSIGTLNLSSGILNVTVVSTTPSYQLGFVTFSGTGPKTINLASTAVGTTTLAQSAVAKGISDETGSSGALIQASDLPSTVANTPALEVQISEGSHYTTTARLRDNAGNGNASTLKLIKSGAGTQTFAFGGAANDYTGGTEVQAGTLLIAGAPSGTPILGSGPVSVLGGRLGGTGHLSLGANGTLSVGSAGTLVAGDGIATSASLVVQNASVILSEAATLAFVTSADGSSFSTLALESSTLAGTGVRVALLGLAPSLSTGESLHLAGLVTGLGNADVSTWTLTGLEGFTAQFANVGGSLNLTISLGSVEPPVLVPTGTGVQISHEPTPSPLDFALDNITCITDPAIAVMPDGSLLIAHSFFGGATDPANLSTKVFRSTDQGATWAQVATMSRLSRASFFTHNGVAYCLGTGRIDGSTASHIVIRKSTDNGRTWTAGPSTTSDPGYIRSGDTGTPSTAVIHENRVWVGRSTLALSGDLTRDLMTPAAWTLHNNTQNAPQTEPRPAYRDAWPAYNDQTYAIWSNESQIVASPTTGVVLLPKIEMQPVTAGTTSVPHYAYIPHTALHRIPSATDAVQIDPANLFVPLPGTEKKFGATYDPATGKFYALTNTVLPAFETHQDLKHEGFYKPQLTRNTGTLFSSRDLVHWDMEKIFIHSDNVAHDAWQYFNFVVHGDHLLIASRTAFKTAQDNYDTPRGHESNLLTFHRIPNYRTQTVTHVLAIENGAVTRTEITDYQPAPLGKFALGAQPFQPVALAEAPDHSIVIQQQDGQLLHYDAQGNFLSVLAELPADTTLTAGPLSVIQPQSPQRTWTQSAGGVWYDPRNWHYFSTPDTAGETVTLGSAALTPASIVIDRPTTLSGLTFQSTSAYTLAAGNITATNGTLYHTGTLTLAANPDTTEAPALRNLRGHHTIAVPLATSGNTSVTLAAGTTLHIANTLTLCGNFALSVDLAGFNSATPPLRIQSLTRDTCLAKLSVTLANLPTNLLVETPIIAIEHLENFTSDDITVTTADGTPVPFSLANGSVSLTPPPLDPGAFTAEELLAYALTETAALEDLAAHLPVLNTDTAGVASFTFARLRSNLNYLVELSTDLENWTVIAENPGTVGGDVTVTHSSSGSSRFFLRLKVAIP